MDKRNIAPPKKDGKKDLVNKLVDKPDVLEEKVVEEGVKSTRALIQIFLQTVMAIDSMRRIIPSSPSLWIG